VQWIKDQHYKLSIRETAREFSNKFWAIKVNPSTVQRIFSGKIHAEPSVDIDTVSIYDLLEGASNLTGSVEDYIDSVDHKKIKY
jgi:hypothetical protein